MTPEEFDRAEFAEGWRYELINGVLIVTSTALPNERDPNDELGLMLRLHKRTHPLGNLLDVTLPEQMVDTGNNRRRVDRVIWIGLGHLPTSSDTPAVAIEFVSAGRRNQERDYVSKRDEYRAIRIQEYWIIDRFEHTLTVYFLQGRKPRKRVFGKDEVYRTNLLPGFELPLAQLFTLADRWPAEENRPQGE